MDLFALDDQRHVFPVGQTGFLALPQPGVNGEGVDSHRQMLGVHLRETLAAGIVPAQPQGSHQSTRFQAKSNQKQKNREPKQESMPGIRT